MKIGFMELVVIAIVALIVVGPDKLPQLTKSLGKALREVKSVTGELSKDIKENIVEPLEEVQKPLKEAVQPLTDLKDEVAADLKAVTKSINDIGKTKAEEKKNEPTESVKETVVVEEKKEEAETTQQV